jgi:glycosyltransferase involved in cell wall biosynthesis
MSGSGDSALNWYSRRLARELVRAGTNVAVVGPRSEGANNADWEDDGVEVHSSFVRQSAWAVWQAYARIASLDNRVVHVQHELFAFGGLSGAFMLPFMLASLRRRGFKLITTIHGVIPLSEITGHFVKANRIPGNAVIARALWRDLVRRVALACDVVHVQEEILRDLLRQEYGLSRIPMRVVPLGIEPELQKVDRVAARGALRIALEAEVALFFGYLSAYKGIDYLLAELAQVLAERANLHIVIAGGVPSRLAGTLDPQATLDKLTVGRDRVHLCGFVSDEDVPMVFAAADVLLLPYRVAMSSSGPLALAIGYDIPVLMSEAFESLFPQAPCFFRLQPGSLAQALGGFFDDPDIRARSRDFINAIRSVRSWPVVANALSTLYDELSSSR